MGRPTQHAHAPVLILLLVAALASASSQPAHPSVMDTLRAGLKKAGGPAHVGPASLQADEYGYDNSYPEQKEICLQEVERTGCFGGPVYRSYYIGGGGVDFTTVSTQPGYWT